MKNVGAWKISSEPIYSKTDRIGRSLQEDVARWVDPNSRSRDKMLQDIAEIRAILNEVETDPELNDPSE